jgi:molybdopterin synthase sulfur carrier subunit
MTVTLRYFAWLREKVGRAEETLELPAGLDTVADLIAWQGTRGAGFADAFSRPGVVRVAIDHVHAAPSAAVSGAREIAFFPPVTGG